MSRYGLLSPHKSANRGKKTLYVARSFPPAFGGAQTLSFERCKAHSPASAIIVLAPNAQGAEEVDSSCAFSVYRWHYSENWPLLLRYIALIIMPLLWTVRLCIENDVEVVEASQVLPSGLAPVLAKSVFRTRAVIWALGDDVYRPARSFIGRLVLRMILYSADRIVTISDYTKQGVSELAWKSKQLDSKIVVFHPPVDVTRFSPNVDGHELREALRLIDKLVILTVARIVERKGIDTMLHVLKRIQLEVENVVYVVVGAGPCENDYRQLAEELELGESVIFAGRVSDEELPQYYAMADLVVLLSYSRAKRGNVEGFGIVLREASATGKPVLGSNIGGTVDAVVDGVTGYTVDPTDDEDIIAAVSELLRDAELRTQLGNNGVELTRETQHWDILLSDRIQPNGPSKLNGSTL